MPSTRFDRSANRVFAVGDAVRLKREFLDTSSVYKRPLEGRIGKVTGYRLDAADPIVEFPKDGRRKAVKFFELPSDRIERFDE